MERRFTFLFVVAVACASPPPPRAAHVVLPPPSRASAPVELQIPHEPADAYAAGWTWWQAGKTFDAMRAFRYVVATLLLHGDPHRRRTREPLRATLEDATPSAQDGDRVLTMTEGGVLLADARKRSFDRFVAMPAAYQAELAGGGLAAVMSSDELVLVDLTRGSVESRAAMQSGGVVRGKSRFVVHGVADGFVAEVWDSASRKRIHSLHDPSLGYAAFLELVDDERAVVATGEHVDVWDVASGAKLLAYNGPPAIPSTPAFSSDGRFVAYGTVDFDKTPTVGTTYLFDRRTKKVVATSHASHFPTGFAFSGKWLAVGDLRLGCLLEVPAMRRVACSAEVRPWAGVDDDLQETTPTFVAGGSALALVTGDGSLLIARVPSMTTLWKGRARLDVRPDGAERLVDSDGGGASFVIGKDGVPAPVSIPAVDDATVSIPSCRVGTWIFPPAACSPAR